MITKYGLDVVGVVSFICFALILISTFFIRIDLLKYILIIFSSAFILFTLYFFRDPDRVTPAGDNLIISPADGKIISIKDIYEDKFLKSDAVLISIFMSPLNVHVNRYPVDGTIQYFEHIPGKYLVAFEDKASDVNERTLIGIESKNGKVLFKQIAGAVARRIVADLKIGMPAKTGERFGMIKFGSRVDVLLPKDKVTVKVSLDQKVSAGETVIAEFTGE
ncbi:MAG: phosphatidylserine decarboxylase family protein [Bacteroidota bacterium]|nr:phosphatidylserine decarboxylase family protein [Bacteroidota bacterium]